ncbi:DNA sulfur modification protein DndB [Pseudoalteromonas galatheae]|uniref:DNA sulfur modification protein DndB n=2 Tax=Pseudoalteromonas galatheae TaxID=579562 RepID=UPI0030CCC29B
MSNLRFLRVSPVDKVVSVHRDFVESLNPTKLKGDLVIDITENDITELCDINAIKKGQVIKGLFDKILSIRKHEALIDLMAKYLDKQVICDNEQTLFRPDGLEQLDRFATDVAKYNMSWEQFIVDYTDLGQARLDEKKALELAKVEQQTLIRSNIDAATEHYSGACFSLPAIAGRMGSEIYYSVQIPFHQVYQLFKFNEEDVPVELRSQRELNLSHAKKAAQYLLDNPLDFTLPALTASVSEAMKFDPAPGFNNVGSVKIPIGANMILEDGQHRRKAIELAIQQNRSLKNNDITVILFYDQGLEKSQQRFADINASMKRPSNAISVLFNRKNAFNQMLVSVLTNLNLKECIEFESTNPKKKSTKIWGVMAIKKSAEILFGISSTSFNSLNCQTQEKLKNIFASFLNAFVHYTVSLKPLVKSPTLENVVEAKNNLVNTHSVYLHACSLAAHVMCENIIDGIEEIVLDRTSNESELPSFALLKLINGSRPIFHFEKLQVLAEIDVSKSNTAWQRRIINEDGTMNPTTNGIKLGAALILNAAKIDLPPTIKEIENTMF